MNKQSLPDTARAILGEVDRQGLFQFTFGSGFCKMPPQGFATAIVLVPMLKYLWQVNVWLYTLELYHCNEWTPPIIGIDEEKVFVVTRVFVSRFKHEKDERDMINHVKFSPHYPWPASDFKREEGVVGIQFPEDSQVINFTYSKHVVDTKPWATRQNEECTLSICISLPIIFSRVTSKSTIDTTRAWSIRCGASSPPSIIWACSRSLG